MTINEITTMSRMGFIQDPGEVRRVIEAFVNLPMKVLIGKAESDLKRMFCTLLWKYDLPDSAYDSISYLDTVYLLRKISEKNLSYKDRDNIDFWNFQIYYIVRIILFAAEGHNTTAKLFLSLNVDSFFSFLEEKGSGGNIVKSYHNKLNKEGDVILSDDVDEKLQNGLISIRDLLLGLEDVENTRWVCWSDFDKYKSKILSVNILRAIITVHAIYHGFIDEIDPEGIMKRLEVPKIVLSDWDDEITSCIKEKQDYGKYH